MSRSEAGKTDLKRQHREEAAAAHHRRLALKAVKVKQALKVNEQPKKRRPSMQEIYT